MAYTRQQSAARRAARHMGKEIKRDANHQPSLVMHPRPIGPLGPGGEDLKTVDSFPFRYRITVHGAATTSWIEPHGYSDGKPAAYVAHQGPGVYGHQAIAPSAFRAAVKLIAITSGVSYRTPTVA